MDRVLVGVLAAPTALCAPVVAVAPEVGVEARACRAGEGEGALPSLLTLLTAAEGGFLVAVDMAAGRVGNLKSKDTTDCILLFPSLCSAYRQTACI